MTDRPEVWNRYSDAYNFNETYLAHTACMWLEPAFDTKVDNHSK